MVENDDLSFSGIVQFLLMTNPVISKRDKKKTIRLFLGNSEKRKVIKKKVIIIIGSCVIKILGESSIKCYF